MKKLIGFLFILILLACAFGYWKYFYTFSDGERCGLLQKFSHKGNIFKTYEGELILSSIASTAGMGIASEKFFFSVENADVANQLKQLDGQRVCLQYTEKNGALPWRGESHYIIESVKATDVNAVQPSSTQPNAPNVAPQPNTQQALPPAQNTAPTNTQQALPPAQTTAPANTQTVAPAQAVPATH